jgi:hypothetical protein
MIKKKIGRIFKDVFIILNVIILVVIITEFSCALYEYRKRVREGHKYNIFFEVPYLEHRLTPNFEGIYEGGAVKVNSLGFRGREFSIQKPKGTYRIIAIGESTTFSLGCSDNEHTYPSLLEKKLKEEINNKNIEVINAGIPSYTSFQCLMLFELELLSLDPDLIIIYTGWNEMGRSIYLKWNEDYAYGFRYGPFFEKVEPFINLDKSATVKRIKRIKYKIKRWLKKKGFKVKETAFKHPDA